MRSTGASLRARPVLAFSDQSPVQHSRLTPSLLQLRIFGKHSEGAPLHLNFFTTHDARRRRRAQSADGGTGTLPQGDRARAAVERRARGDERPRVF